MGAAAARAVAGRTCIAFVLAILVPGASAADRTVVTLGTATPGGGFTVYGQALADAVNAVVLRYLRETGLLR